MGRATFKIWALCLLLATFVNAGPTNISSSSGQTGSGTGGNEWQSAWGNLRAAFRNVGDWFTRQYRTVQGWFATSQQDLERKVGDMVNFLGQVKENANTLAQGADQQMRASLQNVTRYYDDVVQFQNKLRSDTAANFEALQREWQNKVQDMYNGGLDKIVDAAQTAKSAPPPAPAGSAGGQAGSGK